MRRLRATDGTPVHRKAAKYHITQCRTVKHPTHAQLADTMERLVEALTKKARAAEDAEDDETTAGALVDAWELAVEKTIRDVDGELARLDRDDPTLNAQATVFPNGFGEVIDPEGAAQLKPLPGVLSALKPLRTHKSIDDLAKRLEDEGAKLKTSLDDADKAAERADALFAEEVDTRRAIREQMEVAYGSLRALYKSRPAEAERFFQRDSGRRSSPRDKAAPATIPPAAAAAPAPASTGG